jgi:triacylglycerol esterase/lipase EstA (alpha/beta hydrolase family)
VAARLWQRVLASEIAFAAAAAWLLGIVLTLPAPATIASGLAILAALQWLLAVAAWLLARVLVRSLQAQEGLPPERSRSRWAALRSAATEGAALARAALAMSVAPLRRPPRLGSPSGGRRPRPVLLIHGVLCNGAIWRPLVRRLEEAGFGPVRTLELEPLGADIECHAARVAQELTAMQRESGGEQVAIVAHSMGGLVARAALRMDGAAWAVTRMGTVSRIVTIATPHHGTAVAGLLRSKPMRQMSRGSPWLRTLNASPHAFTMSPPDFESSPHPMNGPAATPITSVYSLDDALIVPPSSARLDGARNVELWGVGHLGLLTSRQASEAIERALAGGGIDSARSCKGRERAGRCR